MDPTDRIAFELEPGAGRTPYHEIITIQHGSLTEPAAAEHDEHGLARRLVLTEQGLPIREDRDFTSAVPPIALCHLPRNQQARIPAPTLLPSIFARLWVDSPRRPCPLRHTFVYTRREGPPWPLLRSSPRRVLAKSRHARHSRGRAWCRAAPGTRNAGHQAVAGSDGFVAALAGADAHRFFEAGDEDLAVTDAPRLGSLLDRVDDRMDQVVGHDNLQFDLGDEVHDVSGAAVDLLLAAGPAEAFHLRHGHALDANFR